jgi:type IV secretion system protein TrbL
MRPSLWMLVVLVGATATPCVSAPEASALPGPCDLIGVPLLPTPAKRACEKVAGAAGNVAGDVASDAAKAVAQPIFRQATEWVAQGAGWLVGRVGGLIDTSTTPRLQSRWFAGQYAQMGLLATALALPLLFLAVIQAALARNVGLITRALAAVPVAFVLTGGAVAVVAALLGVTDWACQTISGQTGPNSREFFGDVAKAFNTITDDSGPTGAAPALFVALLASIFAALAALAVWVELLIRSAGIYVCVLFFPVVLVARIWPKLEKWATRLAEALTALILSKFVIVAVLSVAAAAVADSRASEGFNGVLAAGALLVFAAFAPLVLFRLVQFADPQIHARGGNAGTLARGGQTTMSAAQAARISMDRHTGGGLPNASAAQMARSPVAAAGGGVALGASSAARGGGNYAEQAGRGAGSPANQTNGGPSGHNGGGAPASVGAPSGGPRPRGTAEAGNVSGHSPRVPSGTDGQPAGRDAGAADRRPADLGRPRPGQDGAAGK